MIQIRGVNEFTLDVDDIARLGPDCVRRVQDYLTCWSNTSSPPSWLTRAIAYCYEDWCAQQRMDDDGMAQRVWS